MTISIDLEAKILRYYHVEKWRIGTIARELNVHHSAVRRVLSQTGISQTKLISQTSMIVPYLPLILEKLEKHPRLSASCLFNMVKERGYPGGSSHFRHLVSLHRPRPKAEAYLRLKTLPGEQAQVDWGHFGYMTIGKAKRPLVAFVMVLSYSRKIFLRFYLNQRMSNFLRGHENAFAAFGGIPRVCLYDNLKSAVLEREGDAIRFNPIFLEFAAHYRFEPRPCAVYRGNEKGRVERAIRYVRDNFFEGITFNDIDELNEKAKQWCEGIAADRPCPEDRAFSVKDMYEQEKSQLLPLPQTTYPCDEKEAVIAGKTPYIRFDLNDYSIPHTSTRKTLTVNATLTTVQISDGITVIATHPRSYDKGKQIEDELHIKGLINYKKKAKLHRGQDRLIYALPSASDLLKEAAQRGYHLATVTRDLLQLLDEYGATELEIALTEALKRDVPHPNAVRINLQKRREQKQLPPPIRLDLPNDNRVKAQVVRTHNLSDYDQLKQETKDE